MKKTSATSSAKTLRILGIRGIPAAHGGFETFAERLALYLVKHDWKVVVYCQEPGQGEMSFDRWEGVERVHIHEPNEGPRGTITFDWKATAHAAEQGDLCLTLGYNTALFCSLLRLKGVPNLINMDGIEWSRAKWSGLAKAWFWLNDWAGCWLGNHLIADHPHIKKHLQSRLSAKAGGKKITMIPYGADDVYAVPDLAVRAMGLVSGQYLTVIARAEPENSLLEIVRGFSAQPRGQRLVVLGNYQESNPYHRAVKAAASDEVMFVGAIYDQKIVQALRFHCTAYVHGHQVGGTNPSLVEALGAGNAVIAHDNRFNRWVAHEGAVYFAGAEDFADCLDHLLVRPERLQEMRRHSRERFLANFTWPTVLAEYETLLADYLPAEQQAVTLTTSEQGAGQ